MKKNTEATRKKNTEQTRNFNLKNHSMKNIISVGVIIAIIFIVGWFVFGFGGQPKTATALDGFAQCLTQKGFTMYGAYWCPHCQNEKAAFGDAFKEVNYVECTKEPDKCVAAKVDGYPTWIGPGGVRLEGEQGIERLAKASGCALDGANISQ